MLFQTFLKDLFYTKKMSAEELKDKRVARTELWSGCEPSLKHTKNAGCIMPFNT
jgi:hypothetical protein